MAKQATWGEMMMTLMRGLVCGKVVLVGGWCVIAQPAWIDVAKQATRCGRERERVCQSAGNIK